MAIAPNRFPAAVQNALTRKQTHYKFLTQRENIA